MHIIDSSTKELISNLKMNGTVEDIAFAQGGRYMLSFGDEGIVHVWDMDSLQCVHTFEDEVMFKCRNYKHSFSCANCDAERFLLEYLPAARSSCRNIMYPTHEVPNKSFKGIRL